MIRETASSLNKLQTISLKLSTSKDKYKTVTMNLLPAWQSAPVIQIAVNLCGKQLMTVKMQN